MEFTTITKTRLRYFRSKLYGILRLFEEDNQNLTATLSSFLVDLEGSSYYVNDEDKALYLTIVSVVSGLLDYSIEANYESILDSIRREIFGCRNIIDKLIEQGDYDEWVRIV